MTDDLPAVAVPPEGPERMIEVRGLLSQFGDRVIHENLDLDLGPGTVVRPQAVALGQRTVDRGADPVILARRRKADRAQRFPNPRRVQIHRRQRCGEDFAAGDKIMRRGRVWRQLPRFEQRYARGATVFARAGIVGGHDRMLHIFEAKRP